MMKARLAVAAIAIAGMAGSPLAAQAAMHKHKTYKHTKTHSMTTGANMKPSRSTTSHTKTKPMTPANQQKY
ncbi:MAG: hypothetical protein ACRECL_17405 [Bradyrhizobium sp.]